MDMTIDLQQPTEISSVAISVNIAKGDWVFDARNLSVEVSDDGKTFKKIASEEYPAMKETDKDGVVDHQLTFAPVTTQYVRVIASPEKTLPEWHGGKGKNTIFMRETSFKLCCQTDCLLPLKEACSIPTVFSERSILSLYVYFQERMSSCRRFA